MNDRKSRAALGSLSLCILLFFLLLGILSPYTGDDWAWGSSIGLERLANFFRDYNGRYLGNLLVMVLTRSRVVNILVKAGSFYLSCWLCWKYSGSRNGLLLLFSFVLFLLMPKGLLVQTVIWTAGFSNYVPPALIILSYLLFVSRTAEKTGPASSGKITVICFFAGFCGGLFMENMTLFHILLGAAVLIYGRVRFGKFVPAYTAFLAGAVLGAAAMFSNGAYFRIARGGDEYRSTVSGLSELFSRVYEILDYLIVSNRALCSVCTVLLVCTLWKAGPKRKALAAAGCVGNCLSQLLMLLQNFTDARLRAYFSPRVVFLLELLLPLLYLISMAVILLTCLDSRHKLSVFFPLICVPFAAAPLLVVNPIGPRCFYGTYLLQMAFLTTLLGSLLEGSRISQKGLCAVFAVTAAGLCLFYGSIYYPIHVCNEKRVRFAQMQAARGEKTILICNLPNADYLHCSSPENPPWDLRFKLFYGLDPDVSYSFVSAQELDSRIERYPGS